MLMAYCAHTCSAQSNDVLFVYSLGLAFRQSFAMSVFSLDLLACRNCQSVPHVAHPSQLLFQLRRQPALRRQDGCVYCCATAPLAGHAQTLSWVQLCTGLNASSATLGVCISSAAIEYGLFEVGSWYLVATTYLVLLFLDDFLCLMHELVIIQQCMALLRQLQ